MTAPYPQYGPVVNGLYLTKQPNAGVPGGPSVSDALYEVQSCTINGDPSSIVTGEAVVQALAVNAGTIDEGNAGAIAGARLAALVSKNADYMRDFYDSASILRDTEGNPIV